MNPSIAVIDSGVNPDHFHVQKVSGGHGLVMNSQGQVEKTHDYMDEIGHGTAICGIIKRKASFADLYAVKIFQQNLNAPAICLIEALKWAIDKQFNIIHLSLGVKKGTVSKDLKALCQKAHVKNIMVLASAKGPCDKTYPAFFKTVIGVYQHHDCGFDQIVFHPDERIEFGAHGQPRAIPGMPQEQNFRGNSFAVAHITARVAQLVKKHPNKNLSWVKKYLAKAATNY